MGFLHKILGDANEKYLKKIEPIVKDINNLEPKFGSFSDEDLKAKTSEFQQRLSKGETLDGLLPEAFALVREASKRNLNQRPFDVQVMGGIALHQGKIAEMKTGEGKTLAATMPVYLNALEGKGVHVITVNDYLAKRDAVWMGQIYNALGLSVGCIAHDAAYIYDAGYGGEENDDSSRPQGFHDKRATPGVLESETSGVLEDERDEKRDVLGGFKIEESYLRPVERKQAYQADIVYGTNNEFGFDYLRDNMALRLENKVQRPFNFVVLDEIDSILIDEARTPLIISSPDMGASKLYQRFSKIIPQLNAENDYEIDEERKLATLTEQGISRIENILGIDNIYAQEDIDYLHHIEQSLRAQTIFQKDRDYVVKNGEVIIVDEFTGRLMPGRRWSGGLHQAVEAKEGVEIQPESKTLATITFQNYFKLYKKLGGMTGTAATSSEEFDKVYGLEVIVIPTNKPMVRKALEDQVYKTEKGKYQALVEEVKRRNAKGQPILIGTRSIEKNEYLAKILQSQGINCHVLNAKQHEKEAQIIAQAGKFGAVTVATNMAGRGVDIVLGGNPLNLEEAEKVRNLGGLHVIATERHEARRIDNQLRGRAGRQGDPGSSQFFLSLEDDLLRIFGGEKIKSLMEILKVPEDQVIEAKLISQTVEMAQAKIEGMHFDIRKNLLEYDNVLNRHRDVFYGKRDEILASSLADLEKRITEIWEKQGLAKSDLLAKQAEIGGNFFEAIRILFLRIADFYWMQHLEDMDWLKSSVSFQSYASRDPLVEYKTRGYQIFQEMMEEIETNLVNAITKMQKRPSEQAGAAKPQPRLAASNKKPGRNDLCPCGSGKKYKKCCMLRQGRA